MADIDEKFQRYLDSKKFYNFEGESGVRKVEVIAKEIGGYDDIQDFLADNSAACEALVEFIREHADRNIEWKENLDNMIEDDEPEDDEE